MNDSAYEQEHVQLKGCDLKLSSLPNPISAIHARLLEEGVPDTPSSDTTMPRDDLPPLFYVPPPDEEEEEQGSIPRHRRVVRRRSSHLERWIQDQHRLSTSSSSEDGDVFVSLNDDVPAIGTACHPYLAYPHLTTRHCSREDDKQTLESFIVVDDDDVKHADAELGRDGQEEEEQSRTETPFPATPAIDISTPLKSRRYSNLLQAPSPLRNLHFGLSSRRLSSSTGCTSVSGSPSSSGLSQAKSGGPSTGSVGHSPAHKRSHSWGSIRLPGYRSSLDLSPSSWKVKRPSVLGHFSQTSLDSHPIDEDDIAAPRPSFCSDSSYTSGPARSNHTLSTDAPVTPHDISRGSIRTLPVYFSRFSSPPPSEFSVPASSRTPDERPQTAQPKRLAHKASTIRVPFASKNPINYATLMAPTTLPQTMRFGTKVPDVLATPKSKRRRKKLVISGLQAGEVHRFEAVKKWCESFGELSQITRMPNGDIYVHFRKAEVADNVCRLNARVLIAGAGSVSLSWFTGKKPT